MLAFTPEVELITRWFAQCFAVKVDAMSGFAEWKRVSFPRAGNVGEQDSRLHHALEACALISNDIISESRRREEKKRKREAEKKTPEQRRNGG